MKRKCDGQNHDWHKYPDTGTSGGESWMTVYCDDCYDDGSILCADHPRQWDADNIKRQNQSWQIHTSRALF